MLVDNAPLREAMARGAGSDELFTLLRQGDLLLDITGSSITDTTVDGGPAIAAGSTFAVHEGQAADGSRILLAFTRQEEVTRMHADAPDAVQTLGQPSAGVLEFAVGQGYDWLYIDPQSPATAALDISALS
jgi:hypothetical protein